jgi:hypothetical protein
MCGWKRSLYKLKLILRPKPVRRRVPTLYGGSTRSPAAKSGGGIWRTLRNAGLEQLRSQSLWSARDHLLSIDVRRNCRRARRTVPRRRGGFRNVLCGWIIVSRCFMIHKLIHTFNTGLRLEFLTVSFPIRPGTSELWTGYPMDGKGLSQAKMPAFQPLSQRSSSHGVFFCQNAIDSCPNIRKLVTKLFTFINFNFRGCAMSFPLINWLCPNCNAHW